MNILVKINAFSFFMWKEGFSDDLDGHLTIISAIAAVVTWLLSPYSWSIIILFYYGYKLSMMGACYLAFKRGSRLERMRDKMSDTLYRLDLYKEVK